MLSFFKQKLLWMVVFTLSLAFNLHAHSGHGGYNAGYHAGYNHGWEHHYNDHYWHHDNWHHTVYAADPWYSPGFVYYDAGVAYPYYYDGYPYYYYHPAYYWGGGVNVNVNIGG